MKDDKAFGGARVIYVARQEPLEKTSGQKEETSGEEIDQPSDNNLGNLIEYYSKLTRYNSYHSRCLRVKVDCTVNLGIDVIDGNEERVRERLNEVNEFGHSLIEVLTRVALDFEMTGNGYLEVVRGKGGQAEELYHMPAKQVYARPRGSDVPYRYKPVQGDPVPYHRFRLDEKETHSLVAILNYTTESKYYGLPDWQGCASDIELDHYATQYNRQFFINSGVPDMAIVVEGGAFDEATEKAVVEFVRSNFVGVQNAHRILYLPIKDQNVNIKFEKLAADLKNRDMSFKDLRAQVRNNILSAHGVPPRLMGVMSSGQLGGSGEVHGQLKIFKDITINPRQTLFEAKLAPVLQSMGINGKIQFRKLDTDVLEENSTYYPAMVSTGILDIAEAREELGYGKREEQPDQATPQEEDPTCGTEVEAKELVKSLEAYRRSIA